MRKSVDCELGNATAACCTSEGSRSSPLEQTCPVSTTHLASLPSLSPPSGECTTPGQEADPEQASVSGSSSPSSGQSQYPSLIWERGISSNLLPPPTPFGGTFHQPPAHCKTISSVLSSASEVAAAARTTDETENWRANKNDDVPHKKEAPQNSRCARQRVIVILLLLLVPFYYSNDAMVEKKKAFTRISCAASSL